MDELKQLKDKKIEELSNLHGDHEKLRERENSSLIEKVTRENIYMIPYVRIRFIFNPSVLYVSFNYMHIIYCTYGQLQGFFFSNHVSLSCLNYHLT